MQELDEKNLRASTPTEFGWNIEVDDAVLMTGAPWRAYWLRTRLGGHSLYDLALGALAVLFGVGASELFWIYVGS